MLIIAKDFSYRSAFVGAIIGASIGLGMLSVDLAFSLAVIMAGIFGYRDQPKKRGAPIY